MASTIDLTGDDDFMETRKLDPYEVNVKLQSLDSELDRDILFSEKLGLYSIDVGRASKNLDRGMYPQNGNAWIESPVMSRHHALLYLEPGSSQTIYIKDLESTHGTRVNGQKLPPKKKTRLLTGDKISLGSTVRAGPNEFRPKEFQVKCEWKSINVSPIVLTPSPSTEHNSGSRTYSVPSPSGSEDEGVEEFREPNLTNGDEVSISTGPIAQQSSVTSAVVDCSFISQVSTTKEPLSVASKAYRAPLTSSNESFSASDNEAPESLPIERSGSTASTGRGFADAVTYALQYSSDDSDPEEGSDVEGIQPADDKSEQELVSPPYSPAIPKSPSYSPSSPVYSPESPRRRAPSQEYLADPSTNHTEDNWLDHDDEIDVYDDYDEDLGEPRAGDYPSDPSSSSEDSVNSSGSDSSESDESNGDEDTDSVDSDDVLSIQDEDVQDDLDNIQSMMSGIGGTTDKSLGLASIIRDPSPSDAALARPSYNTTHVKEDQALPSLPLHLEDEGFDEMHQSLKQSTPCSSSLPSQQQPVNHNADSTLSTYTNQELFEYTSEHWADEGSPAGRAARGYTQGPFAFPGSSGRNDTHQHPNAYPVRPVEYQRDSVGYSWPYFGGDQLVDMEVGFDRSHSHLTASQADGHSRSWRVPVAASAPSMEPLGPRLPPANKPSRLRIAHLVNGTQESADTPLEIHHASKRKANMISNDDSQENMTKGQVAEQQINKAPVVDLLQPDDSNVENASRMANARAHIVPASDRGGEASAGRMPMSENMESHQNLEQGEPSRKKTKVSHRTPNKSRTWLKKAATHALAGVVGAVAVFATLIATVPEDVQQEAFAEY